MVTISLYVPANFALQKPRRELQQRVDFSGGFLVTGLKFLQLVDYLNPSLIRWKILQSFSFGIGMANAGFRLQLSLLSVIYIIDCPFNLKQDMFSSIIFDNALFILLAFAAIALDFRTWNDQRLVVIKVFASINLSLKFFSPLEILGSLWLNFRRLVRNLVNKIIQLFCEIPGIKVDG